MRKCSVIIPLSPEAQVTPSFVCDLNEALLQMRGRQLYDVCVVFPAGSSDLLEPFRKLCEGSNTVHYQLDSDASVVMCLNKGVAHALEHKCNALVIIPGSMIAPESLSSLCSTGGSADNFGIVSARVYRSNDKGNSNEQEALYFSFLEESKHLSDWQEERTPSPFCFFLSFQLIRERPSLNAEYESLSQALKSYSDTSYSLGFRTLLHNRSFHAFPKSAGEHLYTSSSTDEPQDNTEKEAGNDSIQGVIPAHIMREYVGVLKKFPPSARPSFVVDLRQLPHYADPSFDLGVHIAAAAHARLNWSTTLLVPSKEIADQWDIPAIFPKAEIVIGNPSRCYDYSFYPSYPNSLEDIGSFIALSPNSFFLLQDPFGRTRAHKPHNDALSRIISSFARGIILIGSSGESRFRANLPHQNLPPLLSLLPSQYSKDYPRNLDDHGDKRESSVLICLPDAPSEHLIPIIVQMKAKIGTVKCKIIGGSPTFVEGPESLPYTKLKYKSVHSQISSALFVVLPSLNDELLLYFARALALGKIVITLESDLAVEFKERWHGPRNIMMVQTIEELPSIVQSFTTEAERLRFIATYSSDKSVQSNCSRWSQIGSAVNEFIVGASKQSPVSLEEFIGKQSLLSDFILSTLHFYSHEISEKQNDLVCSRRYSAELESRIKKLEASQVLLASPSGQSRKSTLLDAFTSFQGWGNRSK